MGEVHVRVEGLLDERLVSVALFLDPLHELLGHRPVALGLVTHLLDGGAVHHALREPDVALLKADRVVHHGLVRIPLGLGQLLGGPAYLLDVVSHRS